MKVNIRFGKGRSILDFCSEGIEPSSVSSQLTILSFKNSKLLNEFKVSTASSRIVTYSFIRSKSIKNNIRKESSRSHSNKRTK
jgi:hypothetical protein